MAMKFVQIHGQAHQLFGILHTQNALTLQGLAAQEGSEIKRSEVLNPISSLLQWP